MIRINEIKLSLDDDEALLKSKAAKTLKINEKYITNLTIFKKSVDARRKDDVHFTYSVDVTISLDEEQIVAKCKSNKAMIVKPYKYELPANNRGSQFRPIVVGFGPAGMLAGLILAQAGAQPIILERGKDIDARQRDVNEFWTKRKLDEESNVQFGEGGAGTFSDGKLTTGIKSPFIRKVLDELYEAGAPEEILYSSKPHIGTDRLAIVVKNIRKRIEQLGGEVKLECRLDKLHTANGAVQGVSYICHGKRFDIETDSVIMAIGHSARDTVEMLYNLGVEIIQKPFSVGARIEHPQSLINKAQYGKFAGHPKLGAADYKLACHGLHERGAYTFCMCPGGYVVNASSEPEMLAVNGMSYQARDSRNANSALIVSVTPADFPEEGPLGGVAFQRSLERAAWKAGNGKVPVQLFEDYQNHKPSTRLKDVEPCIKGACVPGDVRSIFPKEIGDSIEEGVLAFGKKIKGFDRPDAVLSGVESRTSSPVRIVRDKDSLEANYEGIYPCGEGAGYAGGITSAAMDGIKVAEAVSKKFRNF